MLGKVCTVCTSNPQMATVVRCEDCQGLFNYLRRKNPSLPGKEKREAPTLIQLRTAYANGVRAPLGLGRRSAGHANTAREPLPDDPEVAAALGVLRDARAQVRGQEGFIYCIAVEQDPDAVKVGFSCKPSARLAELQTGNFRRLRTLATITGTLDDERALHRKYKDDNLLGEWFRPSPQLLSEFGLKFGALYDDRKARQ